MSSIQIFVRNVKGVNQLTNEIIECFQYKLAIKFSIVINILKIIIVGKKNRLENHL